MSDLLARLKSALADRYHLDRELGRGGMAVVFLADDLKHDRKVALKVLRPELAQSIGADRFLKEITIAAQLTHPHILPLFDSGRTRVPPLRAAGEGTGGEDFLYYVMPYVEGESLRDRLNRERQLPMEEAVQILKEVSSALSYAHSRGIVHRDIKPENVLLADGHAVVSDFGIARALDAAGGERLTETGLAVGTPAYMSPEQASGDRMLDGRSDVYSLGCLAYELFGGEPPFTGPSPQAIRARHTLDPVPRLKTLRQTVPEELERAIEKALAKSPADRFTTAARFAEALEQGLTAGHAPASRRPFQRRRVAVGAAAVIAIALAGWWIPRAVVGGSNSDIRSLAVLPLANLSGDPEQEYFVAGMHEGLIDELAQVTPLRVISRRSVLRYQGSEMSVPEIARELGVGGVIDGSVQRAGDSVRLSVRLIRASPDERHLWTETYQRDVRDVLTIHRDVMRAVVRHVGVPVSGAPLASAAPTRQVDPAVYEAYLRGMFHLGKPGLEDRRRGIEYLLEAVERDPGNALAYAGLALGYARLGHDDAAIPDALPRARAAALRAVALDSNLAEAQAALAQMKVYYERDWEGSERAFRRALQLNPSLAITHYHYSWYLLLFDQVEEAIAEHRLGQELDPFTLQHTSDLGLLFVLIGRPDDGIREAQKALQYNPDFPRGLWALGAAYAAKGMWQEAIETHERLAGVAPNWRWVLATTYALSGRRDDARRIAGELERQPSTWNAVGLYNIYAALGDHDAAFRWLDYEQPHAWVPWVRVDPLFAPLRDDPRFADLMRRMNLPPPQDVQRRQSAVRGGGMGTVCRAARRAPACRRADRRANYPVRDPELLMRALLPLLPALTLAAAPAALAAQEHRHGGDEQLGRVTFPVSCNAAAQQRFERAMAGLHSFWWEQGGAAFGAVLEADSTCAMAHWGFALNAWGNPFAGGPSGAALQAGAAAADRAAALGAATSRERGFIAAAGALYRDHATTSNPVRLRAYSDALARAYRNHPDDPEVAIYYALSLVATASNTDTTFARQKQAAAILNPLFRRFPDHPGLAHYIIHANDSPRLAHLALDAARRYADIAPAAPHAQHMPSHIFVRLGLWDETVASNRQSFEAGVAYARAQGQEGVASHEFHALDYMVYGYLQRGQDDAARAVVEQAVNGVKYQGAGDVITNYNRVALEARVPLERGEWRAAAALPVRGPAPLAEMLSRFARGIGAVRSGDPAQARAEVARLAEIETRLKGAGGYDWSRIAGIKRQMVGAWLALTAGDTAAALRDARAAADVEDVTEKHPVTPGELLPARELEGDLLLAIGRYADARRAYRTALEREPGRARSIFGAARAAELAGDTAAARQGYREFLTLMEKADGDRAEIGVARRALASRE